MEQAGWADVRPNDHDHPDGLSRIAPCTHCGHDEHVLRCLALIDPIHEDVVCPCRGVPIPGAYPWVRTTPAQNEESR